MGNSNSLKVSSNLEVEVEVEGDYFPPEREVLYHSDGTGSPGCAATVEVTGVFLRVARDDGEFKRVERIKLPEKMWENCEGDFMEALLLHAAELEEDEGC